MIDHLMGAGIFALFVFLFYGFGSALRKDASTFAENLVVGYIAHSFLIAFAVIPIQIFELSFTPALVAVSAVGVATASYTAVAWVRHGLVATALPLRRWLAENYFLFVLAAALFAIYLLQTDLILNNNNTDDGYYLLKVAGIAQAEDPFNMIYGTGFVNLAPGFNPYHLSSVQTEMGVYAYLTGIDPVVFMRATLNTFHYLLAAASIAWFARELGRSLGKPPREGLYQYAASILLLFAFEYRTIEDWHILAAQDLWQFNSAMWFGGSIVRVMGILWIITPFLSARRIGWRQIAQVAVICVALVSKAAAALPVILVAGVGYLVAYAFTSTRRAAFGGVVLIGFFAGAGVTLAGAPATNGYVSEVFIANLTNPLVWLAAAAVIAGVVLFRTREWLRVGIVLVVVFVMMAVPEVNDVFEVVAMSDFVALRAQTTAYYTLLIAGFVALVLALARVRRQAVLQLGVAAVLGLGAVASTVPVYGNPIGTYRFMAANPHLIPKETAQLSERLEDMAAGEPLDVLAPEWVELKHRRHYLASILRVYAPHVHSLSVLTRFGTTWHSDYYHWDLVDQSAYDYFISSPGDEAYANLQAVLDTYPVQVIVIPGDSFEPYAENAGFELVDQVGEYLIYRR
ncbi:MULTISPECIES: hypothetical protein [Trueperella]|uniref:hypothetical protein n=1 Tax=Trueperella TaxID=1069494 RepID=UPI0008A61446|nr:MULTISPECIES: hypothetical protein [Trueperella]OFS67082.1 hypothetical protein HMPREF3174_04675 [Trueperella sp. HMSC08H06]